MIVHNLHVEGINSGPAETDAPLVVDANTVLPLAIAREGLQAIAWNSSKIRQRRSGMNMIELPFRHRSNTLKPPAKLAPEHPLGLPVPEGPNHNSIILPVYV